GRAGVEDLAQQREALLDHPERGEAYRARALERSRRYSWDAVTDEYERVLEQIRVASGPGSLPPELLDRAVGDAGAVVSEVLSGRPSH
ncbi:MAG: glycosyltransferase, partial [Solirubrobacteraceae bacterium]